MFFLVVIETRVLCIWTIFIRTYSQNLCNDYDDDVDNNNNRHNFWEHMERSYASRRFACKPLQMKKWLEACKGQTWNFPRLFTRLPRTDYCFCQLDQRVMGRDLTLILMIFSIIPRVHIGKIEKRWDVPLPISVYR